MKRSQPPALTPADAINAILSSPGFSEAMTVALTRKPARDAYALLKVARQVLTKNLKADMAGVLLSVTWDRARHTNIITAQPAGVPCETT